MQYTGLRDISETNITAYPPSDLVSSFRLKLGLIIRFSHPCASYSKDVYYRRPKKETGSTLVLCQNCKNLLRLALLRSHYRALDK